MRHALIILAGIVSIGATWIGSSSLNEVVRRRGGSREEQAKNLIVQMRISGLAAILTAIILAYLSIIWDSGEG
jgi:hypothetical protein